MLDNKAGGTPLHVVEKEKRKAELPVPLEHSLSIVWRIHQCIVSLYPSNGNLLEYLARGLWGKCGTGSAASWY